MSKLEKKGKIGGKKWSKLKIENWSQVKIGQN